MYGASGLPTIDPYSRFSMTITKMCRKSGTAAAAAVGVVATAGLGTVVGLATTAGLETALGAAADADPS